MCDKKGKMAGYKRIPKEIKDEVLSLVKQGKKVPKIASEFGINPNTIYKWLSIGTKSEVSNLEYSRIKRERDDLLKIVGNLTLEVEKRKKKRGY